MGLNNIKLGDFIENIIKNLNENFSKLLSKDNTTAYTPTENYHPATKKYVDDAMSSAGNGDMLKTRYDTNDDGIVNQADKVTNKLTIKSGGTTLAEFDGSAAKSIDVIPTTAKGAANGVAPLDSSGKVPSANLPSYVDDVLEGYLHNGQFYQESAHTNVLSPESGKIYTDIPSGKIYRWSGTQYTIISDCYVPEASEVLLTGYTKPASGGAVEATDNVNQAIGKLEKNIEAIPTYTPVKTEFNATTGWSATAVDGIYTLTLTITSGRIAAGVYRLDTSNVYKQVQVGVAISNNTQLLITSYDKFAGYVILM